MTRLPSHSVAKLCRKTYFDPKNIACFLAELNSVEGGGGG